MVKILLDQGLELARALLELPLQIVPSLLQVCQRRLLQIKPTDSDEERKRARYFLPCSLFRVLKTLELLTPEDL